MLLILRLYSIAYWMINKCGAVGDITVGKANESMQKKTSHDLGLNACHHDGKLVTNHLSYGMDLRWYLIVMFEIHQFKLIFADSKRNPQLLPFTMIFKAERLGIVYACCSLIMRKVFKQALISSITSKTGF